MPSVVTFVASGFQAIGFSLATATTLASYAVSSVVSYGISYVARKIGMDDQQQTAQAFDSGIQANKISPVAPIPVVYGRRTVGGAVVFRDLTNSTKDLYQAMVLSEGEIEGLEAVYVNEVPLQTTILLQDELEERTDDRYTYTATQKIATDSELLKQINDRANLVNFEIKKGEDNQDASLLLSASPLYSDNHRGFKVAYLATKITFDRDVFPSGVPSILCDIKGKKLYDPRDGTTAWSDNPALCLLDYLTNEIYGCKIPLSSIDLDTIKTEANYCDELVTVKDSEGLTRQQKRYCCNGVINTEDNCLNNMNKILASMRGMLIFSAGKYKLKIDKLESATFEFTESNILGDWTISGGTKRMIANKIVARFFNSYNRFIETLAVVTDESFVEEDSGFTHEQQLSLHFVSQPQRANILAQMHLKQSRQAWSVEFKANLSSLQVEVGDVVNITNSQAGWTQKPFRVVNIELEDTDTLRFLCSEYDDSVYTYDLLTPETQPDTNLNAGFTPSEPVNFTVESGTNHLLQTLDGNIISRAFLSWSAPVNGFVKSYEVGYKLSSQSDDFWTNFTTPVKEHYIQPVSDGVAYDFRVRALGNQGGAGEYVYQNNVIILGKTQPPANVVNFRFETNRFFEQVFRWDEVADIDKDGYIIKFSTTTSVWEDMTVLHQGLIRTNPFETKLLSEGTYNFAIKAVDKSGNESSTATVIVGTVQDDPNINIFKSVFPHLLGWTGTKDNSLVNNLGELVATSQKDWSDFSTDGLDWANWTSWNRVPNTLTYLHTIDLAGSKKFVPLVTGVAEGTLDIRIGANDTGFLSISDFSTASNYVSSGEFTEGRYVTVYASVSGGANILKSLSILFDGETVSEDVFVSDTPSGTTQDSFTYTTDKDFSNISAVQVTSDQQFVTAQVTNLNQATNTITIAYEKSSGTFVSPVSFYISVKGY